LIVFAVTLVRSDLALPDQHRPHDLGGQLHAFPEDADGVVFPASSASEWVGLKQDIGRIAWPDQLSADVATYPYR
jgi:hypothetical protein